MSNLPEYRQGDVFFPGDRINDVPIGRACPRDKLQLLNMRRGDPGIELCAACAALFTPTPPGALPPWIVNAPPAPGRAENLVPFRERGLAIALQYWEGDAGRAFRLAELLANIEPRFRNDVTLALVADAATPVRPTPELLAHCNAKMRTIAIRCTRGGDGHPDGPNLLWLGAMELLCEMWRAGDLERQDVFTIESDGCPLHQYWIDRIKAEHAESNARGLRVTGPLMSRPLPHINGTLVMSLPWFFNHPSLGVTPAGEAWDVFHRDEIMEAARPSQEIVNIYGATRWQPEQLKPMGKQASWLASTKDNSALIWAEANLTKPPRECPACTHEHVGEVCTAKWSGGRICGCVERRP